MNKSTLLKTFSLALFLLASLGMTAQVNIIPTRTDLTGFSTWTDTDAAGTTYVQLLKATSTTVTPTMNFSLYTTKALNFTARSYGGTNTVENEVFVALSIDNGSTWIELGSRIPSTNGLLPMTAFDLSSYTATQVKVKFYVKGTSNTVGVGIDDIAFTGTVPNCTASNLAFATPTVDKIVGNASFSQVATSLNATTPITYTSSAPAVATVDQTTGEVTIKAIGQTIISATQVAGTHNSVDYCNTSTNYTLNIFAVPTITVTELTVPTMVAAVGATATQTIHVSGTNLTDGIGLAITGTNSTLFSLSTTQIPQSGGIAANTVVTVSYKPLAEGTHTATLTLSSASAVDVPLVLNGSAVLYNRLQQPTADLAVSVLNGAIQFTALSNEKLEVYNTMGQKLLTKSTSEGLNTISIQSQGVLLVRVGNRFTKIIL